MLAQAGVKRFRILRVFTETKTFCLDNMPEIAYTPAVKTPEEKPPSPKPLVWMGDSLEAYGAFRRQSAKRSASPCIRPRSATNTSRKGFGAGVLEVVSDHRGDTFRGVYTVRLAGKVYALHAFQKKSKSGIATPKGEIALVRQRLKRAIELHEAQEN